MDGCTVDIEGEREKVIKCLEAAIRRRVSEVMDFILTLGEISLTFSFCELTTSLLLSAVLLLNFKLYCILT